MSGTRDENIFMARLAEQAERYDDMVEYMRRVASGGGQELSPEERNLLSVAYKNSVGARRSAWRAVKTFEQREASQGQQAVDVVRAYRAKVEGELNGRCTEILQLIQELVPAATTAEPKVFYLKMKGDYYRYLAEFAAAEAYQKCAQDAHDAYKEATDVCAASLPPAHPIRLGLALNFSVFYYEVFSSPDQAVAMAKTSFDDAIKVMDTLDEESKRDCATIMQLLRDNLQLWTADMNPEGGKPPEQDGTTMEDL